MTTGTTYARDALEDGIAMLDGMLAYKIPTPMGFNHREINITRDFLESRLDDEDVVTSTQIYLTEK